MANPSCPPMGISTRRSGLPMPIGRSNRVFGVTFSDGSRTRRLVHSTGHSDWCLKISTTSFRWVHTNRRGITHRRAVDLSENVTSNGRSELPIPIDGPIAGWFRGVEIDLLKKNRWRPHVYSLEPSISIGHICRTGGRWDSNTCTYDSETYVDALI